MERLQRWMRNVFSGWFQLRRCFPADLLDAMAQAIREGERRHLGEADARGVRHETWEKDFDVVYTRVG